MRQLLIATLLVETAAAQIAVNPAAIPGGARTLEYHQGEKSLRCNVEPTKPVLNFGLRFQAGYLLEVPLVQYFGARHTWTTVMRVTPESGGEPVYLSDLTQLPVGPHPDFVAQVTGTFLLGAGRYHVAFAVSDDDGRICRKEWDVAAAAGRGERSIRVAMEPNKVADLSYSAPAESVAVGPPVPRRITVLMNSSPPYRPHLRPDFQPGLTILRTEAPEFVDYRESLLGILSSLLEKLPGTVVRLVVFDLDQEREVLRQDEFTLRDMDKAAHAADDLAHWVVTVRELQAQPGRWGLLTKLIRREINEQDPAEAVLFLGPRIGSAEEMPAHFLESEKRADIRFLYLQYNLSHEGMLAGIPPEMSTAPPERRPSLPKIGLEIDQMDAIDQAVTRLRGKTLTVCSPLDFARAIAAIKRR